MKLLIENWRKFINEAGGGYSAVTLDDPSVKDLRRIFEDKIPEDFKKDLNGAERDPFKAANYNLPHHLTIAMKPIDLNKPEGNFTLGEKVELVVTGYGLGRDIKKENAPISVMALKVKIPEDKKIQTGNPHITFAMSAEGKPFWSNNITEWTATSPVKVSGIVKNEQ